MKIIRRISILKEEIELLKSNGSVGLVPTMGALHEGHSSLVERCKRENRICVVSVFVNPTQFNDKNDLRNYPRSESEDCRLLENAGCDIVFMPTPEEVYPCEDRRVFTFGGLENYMEGPSRPGHFNGVAQIVSKLFDYVHPDKAYFGEKDFQQLAIIRRMTADLHLPIEIVGCPIKRADDGLALSSRNMLLSAEHRAIAPCIYKVLCASCGLTSTMTVTEIESWVKTEIEKCGEMKIEYYTISNAVNLSPAESWTEEGGVQGCLTVKIGGIRLIDNIKYS